MIRRIAVIFLIACAAMWAFSAEAAGRRRAVRKTPVLVPPATITKPMVLSITEPNPEGTYAVSFISWKPLPVGTTITGYLVRAEGREVVPNTTYTVGPGDAEAGFAGYLWGGFSWRDPLPPGVKAFMVEFTGVGDTYSVSTDVPSAGQGAGGDPPDLLESLEVYPDGRIRVTGRFPTNPISLVGSTPLPVEWGWINPPSEERGEDVKVIVCEGYPRSECWTRILDIPLAH